MKITARLRLAHRLALGFGLLLVLSMAGAAMSLLRIDALTRTLDQVAVSGPEREAVMRQAKDLLVAYMPFKVHVHNVYVDPLQPWTEGYWRHPFMRDTFRFVDPGPRTG